MVFATFWVGNETPHPAVNSGRHKVTCGIESNQQRAVAHGKVRIFSKHVQYIYRKYSLLTMIQNVPYRDLIE